MKKRNRRTFPPILSGKDKDKSVAAEHSGPDAISFSFCDARYCTETGIVVLRCRAGDGRTKHEPGNEAIHDFAKKRAQRPPINEQPKPYVHKKNALPKQRVSRECEKFFATGRPSERRTDARPTIR
ncbi:hypothetical protein [uncultured Alistipes sp.]|uniref:hypothetical protein n=1 Tax=uncultured Alistipes sp. TaxID=538949 RepID=UPI00272BE59A|nr:hypothetical protein [uncultured Alistipes sp.]